MNMNLDALGNTRYVVMELRAGVVVEEGKQYALGEIDSDGVFRVKGAGFTSSSEVLREIARRKHVDALLLDYVKNGAAD